jgi:hypothetical protein
MGMLDKKSKEQRSYNKFLDRMDLFQFKMVRNATLIEKR